MRKNDLEIAQVLSHEGLEFSKELRDENRWYFDNLPNSYFSIAAAIGLTWTRHAKFDQEFITYAAGYIDGTTNLDPEIPGRFSFRFGPAGLGAALLNYRRYYRDVRTHMPDFRTCDVHALTRLQSRLLGRLDTLRTEQRVTGIGPWLFTGPFKIILGDQDRLWNQEGINSIVLPGGVEINRGIRRLMKEGHTFVRDFDMNWLEETSGSLLDNFATYNLFHTYLVNIGNITNTPALHINSSLYLYGKQEI